MGDAPGRRGKNRRRGGDETRLRLRYEQRLREDVDRRLAELRRAPVAPAPKKNTEEQSGPWQSKAKQALLVHTAPVHSPDSAAPKILAGRHDSEKALHKAAENGDPTRPLDADQARAAADLEQAYRRAMGRVSRAARRIDEAGFGAWGHVAVSYF